MFDSHKALPDLLTDLRHLLQEERSILLSGSPEQIAGLVTRKVALAETIESVCKSPGVPPPDAETILWLDRYNRGNSVICSAMLRHLTRSLDKLRQRELHRSYGPDGAEHSPPPTQNPLGAA